MIIRLSIGGLLVVGTLLVAGQRRPPNFSQDQMPVTSFSCRDKIIGGYYADPETDCQMFHVCVKVPGQGVQDYKFLCPNDTSFDQENQICDDWFNIDCEAATLYYSDNFDLYRIGSDYPGSKQSPRLPSNNINNAVSENDDDFYLQKSDRGDSVGSDLLRGSHTSNFYSNKQRGREDEDQDEVYTQKPAKTRKLLTGKRPLPSSTQAPITTEAYTTVTTPYQRKNSYSGRVSNFRGHARGQQPQQPPAASQPPAANYQPSSSPAAPISRGGGQPPAAFQRTYYTPTTPRLQSTAAPTTTTTTNQRNDFFRNYNSPTTNEQNYYNSQNNNNGAFPQPTTRNYYNPRVTTITTTQPSTTYVETTQYNNEKNNLYETAKLYRINTGGINIFNQYDEPKDEFLKTAPSQNLGASAFNSLQNSYKTFNNSNYQNYNFNTATIKPTTFSYQTTFNPSTQDVNYYSPTTLRPFQHNSFYTTQKVQTSSQNYYSPTVQTSSTTVKPAIQQTFQQQSQPTTFKPFQYNPTTLRPVQYSGQSTVQPPSVSSVTSVQRQTAGFQPQKNSVFAPQQNFQPVQRNPSQFQTTPVARYNPPTTQRASYSPVQTTLGPKVTDSTEQPRPFAQGTAKPAKQEKEQYDYAYYDDGTHTDYDSFEPLEEFKRTKSKNDFTTNS